MSHKVRAILDGFDRVTFDNTARLRQARRTVEKTSPSEQAWRSTGQAMARAMSSQHSRRTS